MKKVLIVKTTVNDSSKTESKRLKTYKIKNHDSGKTYSVKAVNYTDAKTKYNKHILKDSSADIRAFIVNAVSKLSNDRNRKADYAKVIRGIEENAFGGYDVWPTDGLTHAEADKLLKAVVSSKYDGGRVGGFIRVLPQGSMTADSFADADKSMGKYRGYSIKQNVDGNIYVLKKSGEKEFFESWKKAHEAIKTGAIKDSHSLKTYTIKNTDSGKTYSVKATSYTDAKDKYNEHILKDSFTEDNSFNALFQFRKEVKEISFNSDERVIRSVFLKAETIAKQVESSIKGLSAQYNTKLANLKKDPHNKTVETEYYKVVKVVSSIKSALVDCMQFFKTSGGEITRALSVWKNGRIIGERFEGKTDKYLSMAKKYHDRFLQIYQQLNRTLQDSLTEDAEMAGWIAIYNGTRIEIAKSEADSLYAAKKLAILKFKEKFKHVKEHMISIAPGYNDSITEDADIAQTDIKSTYLPEDANADNIQYLGFNEKRKLSFYGYGDRYFVHYDLEGRTEEVDKETVQKILKKNILGEIDENDLINKEPQSEEIVTDAADIVRELNDMMYEYGYSKNQFQKFLKDVHLNKFTDKQFNEFGIKGRQEVIDYAKEVKAWKFDSFDWKNKQERGDR